MRSRLMLLCGLIVAAISMYTFAQVPDEESRLPEPGPTSGAILIEEEVIRPAADDVAQETRDDQQTLREQYLKLVEEKADLMDSNVFREEISRLERGIKDLKATAELARTRSVLHTLIQTYPNTPAAAIAQRMLHAAEATPTPAFEIPRDAPVYDPGYPGPRPATPLQPTPDPATSLRNSFRSNQPSYAPTPSTDDLLFDETPPPKKTY